MEMKLGLRWYCPLVIISLFGLWCNGNCAKYIRLPIEHRTEEGVSLVLYSQLYHIDLSFSIQYSETQFSLKSVTLMYSRYSRIQEVISPWEANPITLKRFKQEKFIRLIWTRKRKDMFDFLVKSFIRFNRLWNYL